MKQLSMWLTVMLLGGLPLAAAALDYGPNRPLLAAESGAPQLPTAQGSTTSMGQAGKSDLMETGDDAPEAAATPPRMTPSAASPTPVAAAHSPGPSASNKSRNQTPPKPVVLPDSAAWRSLLPGSIQ